MIEGLGISETSYNFINCESEEENKNVARIASGFIDESLKHILNSLLDKEGRKGDTQKSYDNLMHLYGRDARLLSLRILDELLSKEQKTNT